MFRFIYLEADSAQNGVPDVGQWPDFAREAFATAPGGKFGGMVGGRYVGAAIS